MKTNNSNKSMFNWISGGYWLQVTNDIKILYDFTMSIRGEREILVYCNVEEVANSNDNFYVYQTEDSICVVNKTQYSIFKSKRDINIECGCGCGGMLCVMYKEIA